MSLFHILLQRPQWFDVAHDLVWQSLLLLATLAFVMSWLNNQRISQLLLIPARMVIAFVPGVMFINRLPEVWLNVLSSVGTWVVDFTSPHLSCINMIVDGQTLSGKATFHLAATFPDGQVLPSLILNWHYSAGPTLLVLPIALAVWAAPPMALRRRLLVLPAVLLAAALLSSVDLSIEL